MLSHLLHLRGVESVVVDLRTRADIEETILRLGWGVSQSQLPYCTTYGPRLAARPGEGLKSPCPCSPRPVRSRDCYHCRSP